MNDIKGTVMIVCCFFLPTHSGDRKLFPHLVFFLLFILKYQSLSVFPSVTTVPPPALLLCAESQVKAKPKNDYKQMYLYKSILKKKTHMVKMNVSFYWEWNVGGRNYKNN